MNQKQRILEHMGRSENGITAKTAMNVLGCYRLAARVFDLRDAGHDIITILEESENRHGDKVTFARYYLLEKGVGSEKATA